MAEAPNFTNPKRTRAPEKGRAGWYPYYAGFSQKFAEAAISSAALASGAKILDPWNGSGTTTATALSLGFHAVGFDLNPAMVIVAKARMLCERERPSLSSLACKILEQSRHTEGPQLRTEEPLETWFLRRSARSLRSIEAGIQRILVDAHSYHDLALGGTPDALSDIAAFFYLALFSVARGLIAPFVPSNPTWTKKPTDGRHKLRPTVETIHSAFSQRVESMIESIGDEQRASGSLDGDVAVSTASSSVLPLSDNEVDFVLTSPPYCTRIDYAVATAVELAVLGHPPFCKDGSFGRLRGALLGTVTVPDKSPEPQPAWGQRCLTFLKDLAAHRSKASGSYYLKTHLQYFDSLHKSLREMRRVMKPEARSVLVIQDSYYKDLHNDLPTIASEMGENLGMTVISRTRFESKRTMASVNPRVAPYRSQRDATEEVICLSA